MQAAHDAVFDAWMRAENIILDKELMNQYQGEYEEEEMDMLQNI